MDLRTQHFEKRDSDGVLVILQQASQMLSF